MRRILLLTATLVLSACASAPLPPEPQAAAPLPVVRGEPAGLIGLTAAQLVGRLGNPALQIREGSSLKLQFRTSRCVLDAYLYPQSANDLRVAHVDTRAPSGVDTNQAACIAEFAAGR